MDRIEYRVGCMLSLGFSSTRPFINVLRVTRTRSEAYARSTHPNAKGVN